MSNKFLFTVKTRSQSKKFQAPALASKIHTRRQTYTEAQPKRIMTRRMTFSDASAEKNVKNKADACTSYGTIFILFNLFYSKFYEK